MILGSGANQLGGCGRAGYRSAGCHSALSSFHCGPAHLNREWATRSPQQAAKHGASGGGGGLRTPGGTVTYLVGVEGGDALLCGQRPKPLGIGPRPPPKDALGWNIAGASRRGRAPLITRSASHGCAERACGSRSGTRRWFTCRVGTVARAEVMGSDFVVKEAA